MLAAFLEPSLVRRLLSRLEHSLALWSPWQHVLTATALTVGVGLIDLLTGPVLSLTLFYLIPVGLSSWYVSPRAGFVVTILSAAMWFGAVTVDHLPFAIALWNAVIRFGFLTVYITILAHLKRNVSALHYMAYHDALTDVLNRRAFQSQLESAHRHTRASSRPLTLAYLDLDNFKQVNDRHGHAAGDALLVRLASVLRAQLRAVDQVARVGGDEFALLLQDVDTAAASAIIARIQQQVDEMLATEGWAASVSIGVVTFREVPQTVDTMLHVADQLMYDVKAAGKHGTRYTVYPPER
jgi:diguanylate cyclase (GGDEF)-like protein